MKTSGAPEKGDLVSYEWRMEYREYQTTALVVGEHGIAVKVLMFGLRTRDWRDEGDYRMCDYNIHKMTVPRDECKILRTKQGEIIVKNL